MKQLFSYVLFFLAVAATAQERIPIVAVTSSGARLEIASPDLEATELMLGPADERFHSDDPIVRIEGVGRLASLRSVTIVLLPQLRSFDFLAEAPALSDLTISYCRFDSLDYLGALPQLERLRIEMCRSVDGGPLLADGVVDLSANPRLESIVFLDCALSVPPVLKPVPARLRILDLSWNDFDFVAGARTLPEGYRAIDSVVLRGARVPDGFLDAYPNVIVSVTP